MMLEIVGLFLELLRAEYHPLLAPGVQVLGVRCGWDLLFLPCLLGTPWKDSLSTNWSNGCRRFRIGTTKHSILMVDKSLVA